MHIGKEEVKMPLFADKMILSLENPKDFTTLLELTKNLVTFWDTKSAYKSKLSSYTLMIS
jgi:hypothetical protein